MSKSKLTQSWAEDIMRKTEQKPCYKLDTLTSHDAFVAWDNSPACTSLSDRLCVGVTVRKLPLAEAKVVSKVIQSMHGFDPAR